MFSLRAIVLTDLPSDPKPPDRPSTASQLLAAQHSQASSPSNLTHQEALSFLYDRINYEGVVTTSRYPFRLRRMAELVERLGIGAYLYQADSHGHAPPKPLVHIAGTKGKGSTAAMVASILTAAGLRTGLYTSPHLNDLEERFQIDSVPCEPAEFIALIERIRPVVETMDRDRGLAPTFFELTTAMAMLHFHLRSCDAIVLEVGLGGRLDSTNVFASSVTAITSIGLDHQHVLGNTITEIATEKAGIFKPVVPVVSGVVRPEAIEVVHRNAAEGQSPIYQYQRDFHIQSSPEPDWGSELVYTANRSPLSTMAKAHLALEGKHQAANAAVAIAVTDVLRDALGTTGQTISEANISAGLADVQSIARVERFDLERGITAILDAAHNEDSIAALVEVLNSRFQNRTITIVFGTSRDKAAETMLAQLAPIAHRLYLTQYKNNPRRRDPSELFAMLSSKYQTHAMVIEDPVEACEQAKASTPDGGVVVVCGSFFLAAETRPTMDAFRSEKDA
ncbi:Folylpolyglutamate synthase [Planctomycetes bacterium CA13]|uniref:Dihydrofolate synthase/folylpolyglutamate synthase n=1 Tax=Novipirellula herctigrandis TaxID=2527986 RepID=A0A5C5Z3W9_9BACT|nr:Folylpolyglutamate synthase [Planctomycetes bacterium CA13]